MALKRGIVVNNKEYYYLCIKKVFSFCLLFHTSTAPIATITFRDKLVYSNQIQECVNSNLNEKYLPEICEIRILVWRESYTSI